MVMKTKKEVRNAIGNQEKRLATMSPKSPAYQVVQNRLANNQAKLRDFQPQIAAQPSLVEPQMQPKMPAQAAPMAQPMQMPSQVQQIAPASDIAAQKQQYMEAAMQMPNQNPAGYQGQPQDLGATFDQAVQGLKGGQLPNATPEMAANFAAQKNAAQAAQSNQLQQAGSGNQQVQAQGLQRGQTRFGQMGAAQTAQQSPLTGQPVNQIRRY